MAHVAGPRTSKRRKNVFPRCRWEEQWEQRAAEASLLSFRLGSLLVEILTYCSASAEHVLHALCFDYLINKRKCR